ncbi:hypothetical protein [Brevibacillus fluminis]|uniref:hypothetical protein n=1 Tax=Brevibacillus fluminis TaxID=511487 RepID=UPI001605CA79|nr:hypothetical protein [Brevibacillus fluminis]
MTKLISMLAIMVIVTPLTVNVLIQGPDNLLTACTSFFTKLFSAAVHFGTA